MNKSFKEVTLYQCILANIRHKGVSAVEIWGTDEQLCETYLYLEQHKFINIVPLSDGTLGLEITPDGKTYLNAGGFYQGVDIDSIIDYLQISDSGISFNTL